MRLRTSNGQGECHREASAGDPDVVRRSVDAAVGALDKHLGAHHFLYGEDDAVLALDRNGSPAGNAV